MLQNQNSLPNQQQGIPDNIAHSPKRSRRNEPTQKSPVPITFNASYSTIVIETVAGANIKALGFEPERVALVIQNHDTNSIYINFDSEANTQSTEIIGGGTWEYPIAPINSIFIFSLFNGGTVALTQGLR